MKIFKENYKKTKRLATLNEQSARLRIDGYSPDTCAGKCLVHSETWTDGPLLVKGIEHKCGKSEQKDHLHVIVKYSNRKMYSKKYSEYINSDALLEMVKNGEKYVVTDVTGSKNLTAEVEKLLLVEVMSKLTKSEKILQMDVTAKIKEMAELL